MVPFHQMDWSEISAAWEMEVKTAHSFLTSALMGPMKPGDTTASFPSAPGLSGSRLSAGDARAKRMRHVITGYARQEADQSNLNLRIASIISKQRVEGTENGRAAAEAYSPSS